MPGLQGGALGVAGVTPLGWRLRVPGLQGGSLRVAGGGSLGVPGLGSHPVALQGASLKGRRTGRRCKLSSTLSCTKASCPSGPHAPRSPTPRLAVRQTRIGGFAAHSMLQGGPHLFSPDRRDRRLLPTRTTPASHLSSGTATASGPPLAHAPDLQPFPDTAQPVGGPGAARPPATSRHTATLPHRQQTHSAARHEKLMSNPQRRGLHFFRTPLSASRARRLAFRASCRREPALR